MSDTRYLDWPFFEERHRAARARARRLGGRACAARARRGRGRRMPRAGALARRGRLAAPRGRRPAARRGRCDRHPRDLPDPRDPGAPQRPGGFRVRHAGPGLGRDQPAGHAANRRSATCRGWRAARRSRPSRCPSRKQAPMWRRCSATPTSRAAHAVLNGEKTWISNGGIADFYVVFCRTGEAPGARGISAFIVDAGTPGFEIAERIDVIAPHPLARLRFTDCRVPLSQRVGEAGEGFKVAMRTLDVFRTSVAAAALGFARRALDEALAPRHHPQDVQPGAGRLPAHAGEAGADGHHDRQLGAAGLPRRLAARPGPGRDDAKRRWPSSPPPRARSR